MLGVSDAEEQRKAETRAKIRQFYAKIGRTKEARRLSLRDNSIGHTSAHSQ